MSAHARHLLRATAIAAVVCLLALVAAAMYASAYYSATGRGSAAALVGTLGAPTITNATAGAGTVALTWSAVSAPASGAVTYYVSRDGGAASAACPGSAAPSSATSCTDTGVSAGAHQYTVTAVWRTWTATSTAANVTVASGAATRLVFTTSPAGATGGTAFTTQPVVTAQDSAGNTVASYSGTVALTIVANTGTTGATLSGCAGTLRAGVTSFSGCQIDKAGTSYQLHASDGRLTAADSSAIDVIAGAATRLAFTTQPSGATGGTAFATQPVVTAQDAGGNTATTYAGTVALTIASGTNSGGATLSGCTGTLRSGVTTFTGCQLDKVGTAYKLHASDTRLAVDSAAFDVTPGVATRLVVTTQPSGATGGTAFTTQPVVTAQDAGGNTATGYAGTVTLSIARGTTGATLSGCTSALRGGVTTFAGCTLDKVGTTYVLLASDRTLSVSTNTFSVTAGPATRLAFSTEPGGAAKNSLLSPQPVVTALDAGGNVATAYAGTVALTLSTNPAGGSLNNCVGSLSSGVTTFSGCRVNKSGAGYVMQASDGTLSVLSNPFTIS